MTKEQLLIDIDNLLERGMVAMVERWELKGINPNIYHAFLMDEVKSFLSSSYDKIREEVLKEVREKVEKMDLCECERNDGTLISDEILDLLTSLK